MEVILLEKVQKLGAIGDTVKVKDGFARNFLLPRKKALRATKDNISYFEVKKAEIEKENKGKIKDAEAIAKQVDKAFFTLIRQAGEDGRLFGSVTARDIAQAIGNEAVDKTNIILSHAIKYLGVHKVNIHLHADVDTSVFINVARTENEAKEAQKEFLQASKPKKPEAKAAQEIKAEKIDESEQGTEITEENKDAKEA